MSRPRERHVRDRGSLFGSGLMILLVLGALVTFGAGLVLGRLWGTTPRDVPAQTAAVAGEADPPAVVEVTVTSPPAGQEATAVPRTPTSPAAEPSATASPVAATVTPEPFLKGPFVYGHSFDGRELLAYRLGTGASARALIGGIHGGYEWNTTLLVSETLAYLEEKPALVPSDVTLYIIPCANPDGAAAGTDAIRGRVNGNDVDLNRNWDYNHQITATHGTRPVFAGDEPFSEPETRALRDFISDREVELAIFYHSAMAKVFSGAERQNCATYELAEMMSDVTGYEHSPEGVYGQVTTGDAIDYLSKVGITAIEIELTNHQDIDWDRNWRGVLAFLEWELPAARGGLIEHEVQPGETLSYLAVTYNVSEQAILDANAGLDDPNQIMAGQVILVPGPPAER